MKKHSKIVIRAQLLSKIERRWVGKFFCWIWIAGKGKDGYPLIKLDKTYRAHRVSFETFKGPIPPGKLVLHKCDHPLCINPSHLFLGSDADNTADKLAKGRLGRVAKLTKNNVLEIRIAVANGAHQGRLAKRYGVGAAQITRIHQRKEWRHV